MFNRDDCIVRKFYCGNKSELPSRKNDTIYHRTGTRYECLRRGVGIGKYSTGQVSPLSLQNIKYIGPTYESKFEKYDIYTLKTLISVMKKLNKTAKRKLLKDVFTRTNNSIDQKAYNSVILFLYNNQVKNLPTCKIVKE